MTFLNRSLRPVAVVLGACLILFLLKTHELASLEREVAPAIAELNAAKPGTFHGRPGMDAFIRDYMADPFGQAIGLSVRQLQLCRQVSAMIPAYQSAIAWRSNALLIGLSTLLWLLFKRYAAAHGGARFADYRYAAMLLLRRIAARMEPLIAKARQRVGSKRWGAAPHNVHTIVSCPRCPQKLRVPAGRGRIRITCSACGATFESWT